MTRRDCLYLCDFVNENMFTIPNNDIQYYVFADRKSSECIYFGNLSLLMKLVLIFITSEVRERCSMHIKEKIRDTVSDLINQNLSNNKLAEFITFIIIRTNSHSYELDIIKILLSSNILNLQHTLLYNHTIFDWALDNDNCDAIIMKLLIDKITIPTYRDILFVSLSKTHSDIYSTKLDMLISAGFTFKKFNDTHNLNPSTTPVGRLYDCYDTMIKQYRNELARLQKEYDIIKKSVELSPDGQYINDLAQHFADLSKLQ